MKKEIHLTDTTLRDSFRIIFRRQRIIFLCMIIVPLTVYVGLLMKTPVYEAQAKMLVTGEQQSGAIYYRDLVSQRNTEISLARAETVKSVPVLGMVVKALNLHELPLDYEKQFASSLKRTLIDVNSDEFKGRLEEMDEPMRQKFLYRKAINDLRKKVSVDTIRNTNIFTVKVRDYDPEMAALLANVISRAYMIVDLREQLSELNLKYGSRHPTIMQLNDNIQVIRNNLVEDVGEDELAFRPATVKPIEAAIPPSNPVGPSRATILLASMLVGLILGFSLALVLDHADQTIKTPDELKNLLHLPILGSIPKQTAWKNTLIKNMPKMFSKSLYAEAYRHLSNQLRLLVRYKGKKTILVTASEGKEGTSTVVCNLAHYLSEHLNLKVLVIDGNLKSPSAHRLFHIKESPGLSDFLGGTSGFYEVLQKLNYNLSVVAAGEVQQNVSVALNSEKMDDILQKARSKFDVILIDSPDLKSHKDAIDLASYVDGILFLVSENKTRKHVIDSVLSPLIREQLHILGTVLNMRTYVIPGFIYSRI